MMTIPTEMEMKYLISGRGVSLPDEKLFEQILRETRELDYIHSFDISEIVRKERTYRYFDTFKGDLDKSDLVVYVGPIEQQGASVSGRDRGADYVLAVKFPIGQEGELDTFPLPKDTEFDKLDPNVFTAIWPPIENAKRIGGNVPLQEVVRLSVKTYRFVLAQENPGVEVALDQVKVEVPFLNRSYSFHELVIESLPYGEQVDVFDVCRYFMDKYAEGLLLAPQQKWIKARQIVRGEAPEIIDPWEVPGLLDQL